jgi:hypothetical protein
MTKSDPCHEPVPNMRHGLAAAHVTLACWQEGRAWRTSLLQAFRTQFVA